MKKFGNTSKLIMSVALLMLVAVIIQLAFHSFVGYLPVTAMALIPLTPLPKDEATCNMAGIASIVYVIKADDIQTFPQLAPNKTLPEHSVDLIGDFVLKTGKFWQPFYSTQEMGELISEVEGNRDGLYFKNTGSFFYPNTTSRALGIANILKDTNAIILIKEFNGTGTGVTRVIGTDLLPTMIKPSITTGKAFADQKGITFNFESSNCSVPYIYTGIILTEASEIQTPTAITSSTIDANDNSRFVIESPQSGDVLVTTFSNFESGSVIRIENNVLPTDAWELEINAAYGTSLTLIAGEYADLFFVEENLPIILNTNHV